MTASLFLCILLLLVPLCLRSGYFFRKPEIRFLRSAFKRRRLCGSILVMSMFLVAMMFVLGMSYLFLIHTDRRQYGVLEREAQAWYLAASGEEYFKRFVSGTSLSCLSGAEDNICRSAEILKDGSKIWARVCIPKNSRNSYFEIIQRRDGQIEIKGAVHDSLSASRAYSHIERSIILDKHSRGWDYGVYQRYLQSK